MSTDINGLAKSIAQWGLERNITSKGGASPLSQMSKMLEEFAEWLVTYDNLQTVTEQNFEERKACLDTWDELDELQEQLKDDFGDMLVCLIQAMRLVDTDLHTCLAVAWEGIKDRKGKMINGKFVKE